MDKSLLELLEEEKIKLQDIRFCKDTIEMITKSAPVSCLASEYQSRLEDHENELLKIRIKIKEYFSFIMK